MSSYTLNWIYVLEESFEWQSPYDFGPKGTTFVDQKGEPRLELLPKGRIRVLKSYAWDGCSPKFSLFDIIFGTPDGAPHRETKKPKTYFASLVHDALYQFLDAGVPLNRAQADRIFLQIMAEHKFAPRHFYYAAVRLFGWLFRFAVKRRRWVNGGVAEITGRTKAKKSRSKPTARKPRSQHAVASRKAASARK